MEPFKVGDSVCLKTGTLRMTVLELVDDNALCAWQTSRAWYPVAALKHAGPEPEPYVFGSRLIKIS